MRAVLVMAGRDAPSSRSGRFNPRGRANSPALALAGSRGSARGPLPSSELLEGWTRHRVRDLRLDAFALLRRHPIAQGVELAGDLLPEREFVVLLPFQSYVSLSDPPFALLFSSRYYVPGPGIWMAQHHRSFT